MEHTIRENIKEYSTKKQKIIEREKLTERITKVQSRRNVKHTQYTREKCAVQSERSRGMRQLSNIRNTLAPTEQVPSVCTGSKVQGAGVSTSRHIFGQFSLVQGSLTETKTASRRCVNTNVKCFGSSRHTAVRSFGRLCNITRS